MDYNIDKLERGNITWTFFWSKKKKKKKKKHREGNFKSFRKERNHNEIYAIFSRFMGLTLSNSQLFQVAINLYSGHPQPKARFENFLVLV